MTARNTTATKSAATAVAEALPETPKAPTAVEIVEYLKQNDMANFQTAFIAAEQNIKDEVGAILKAAQEANNTAKSESGEVLRIAKLAGVENHRLLGSVRSITIMEKASSKILAINCDRFAGEKATRNDRHPFPFTAAKDGKKGNEQEVLAAIEKFKPIALRAALAGLEILNPIAEASAA